MFYLAEETVSSSMKKGKRQPKWEVRPLG